MCRSSLNAARAEDAQADKNYEIGLTLIGGGFRHGVLHRPGEGTFPEQHDPTSKVVACAICIREDQEVTLFNIPDDLQRELHVGPITVALFLSGDLRLDQEDCVAFPGGKEVRLELLAGRGIVLALGALEVQPGIRTAQKQLEAA